MVRESRELEGEGKVLERNCNYFLEYLLSYIRFIYKVKACLLFSPIVRYRTLDEKMTTICIRGNLFSVLTYPCVPIIPRLYSFPSL